MTLYITQNSPFSYSETLLDGITPIDITGETFKLLISKYYGSQKKYQYVAVIGNPLTGTFVISISENETKTLPYGTMVYTIYRNNTIYKQGTIVIIPSIIPDPEVV